MAHCVGTKKTPDGTFFCKEIPVAAYTWDGCPFNYKGKPGAAVCAGHMRKLTKGFEGLKRIETISEAAGAPQLTADERRALRLVKDGADVYDYGTAILLRALEKRGLVTITKAMDAPTDGGKRQPYFGAIAKTQPKGGRR